MRKLYIDEILKNTNCTLKLSCFDPESNALLDFDVVLLSNQELKQKIDSYLTKKGFIHYIIVENIIYDKKKIDFSSKTVESSLYMTLKNGKTYRFKNVKVTFIRVSNENLATCITTKQNAFPYNRRDTFRIPVDCDGLVYWDEDEKPEKCYINDVSHDGIGISLTQTSRKLLKGLPAKVTWEETAHFDNNKPSTRKFTVHARIVRRQTTLDNIIKIGMQMKEEPDAIRDYIQWAQVHRGFINNNDSTAKKGVNKQENWQLQRQLEQMSEQE